MEQNGSTLAWIGGAPARVRVDRVRIDFAHTRTILRAVRVVIDEVTTEFELEGFSASVTLDPVLVGTGESDQVRVEVDFEGEAPRPMAVLVNGDKSLPIPDWLPAGLVVEDRPPEPVLMRLYKLEVDRRAVRAESVRVDSVAAPDTSSAEVFKQRKLAIERDALVKQAFFAHDFATNPGLDLGRWQAGMADLNAHLGDRVQFYSAFATNHASFPDYGPVDEPYLRRGLQVRRKNISNHRSPESNVAIPGGPLRRPPGRGV